jgi:hypothetical protein
MHFGQDVIAKANRFKRAFEDYLAEHYLLLGWECWTRCYMGNTDLLTYKYQVVSIKKAPGNGAFSISIRLRISSCSTYRIPLGVVCVRMFRFLPFSGRCNRRFDLW